MVASSSCQPLVLRRAYPASPEIVFQVWTNSEYMKQWFRPSKDFTHRFVEVDLRVGGRYRVAFEAPDGRVDVVGGEFLEITPPGKLVYSWMWEEPNEHAGIPSRVTVEFLRRDGGTELVLTHELADAEMKQRHLEGWTGALDLIPEVVDRIGQTSSS
ncbi:MAG: SRPBCC domain-containing protein [Pirellulales bacterium]|nr:SRPBCC domain-containing protein [Pirellulales bacterium]